MIGNYNYDTNFPHKLLLTDRKVSKLRKAFANNSSVNTTAQKTQLSKILRSRGFLGRLVEPLLNTSLPSMKNVFKPLAKNYLISLRLTAAAADAGIHKKSLSWGCALRT